MATRALVDGINLALALPAAAGPLGGCHSGRLPEHVLAASRGARVGHTQR